ncbi:MAG: AAA family ATPase [Gammaproteobacteria bacterium]|nr:AAA family ATPase [Gammaproteobacteria bacterium]
MYYEYFGFKEAPFSIAPDPHYLYMTAQHREALAHLVYGLNSEGGCILLTGEVGTGKTTICRCLLEQIPEQANVALVLNPKVSEIELLETICDELKISYPDSNNSSSNGSPGNSVKTYTDRIYEFLIKRNQNNEKTVLIIDEAQNLDSKVLEQLRLLTNLETNQRKLLQIIILGQPELLDILARTEMRQLAQRITARFHLQPLTRIEVKAYVSHRLAIAGQNIQLFPEKSIKLLYKLSNGVPRLINIICDRALLGAYVEAQHAVHPAIIKKAANEVFGELKNVEKQHKYKQWLYPVTALISITAVATILFLYFTLSPVPEPNNNTNSNSLATDEFTRDGLATVIDDATELATRVSATEKTNETFIEAIDDEVQISDFTNKQPSNSLESDVVIADNSDSVIVNNTESPPVQEHDDIEKILNTKIDSPVSAYQALFKIWKQKYNKKSFITACKQAESFALSCLHKQGNINSLKAHNRPAVLKLINSNGEIHHVTITSIQNKLATIYSDNKEHTIKLSELDKYWYGRFVLLWKKPEYYSSAVIPGNSGNIVNWLRTHFTDKNYSTDKAINTYDIKLLNEVKNFQAQHGLTADGIVGPVTIIHLNTESDVDVPTLTWQS